ncbi:MAG: integration host factor subunit beta [Planctomycetes bacterium]|nr:integration host factor subunit beta [Planctomycetota bacterium]
MATLTKKELTDRIADAMKQRRALVRDIVQRFFAELTAELARGNRVEFRDFGVFETRLRKARTAQNPRTLQRVPVPVKCAVKFKAGRLMKQTVQKALAAPRGKGGRAVAPSAASQAPPPSP